uniref:Nucleolar MIF4G domain-containing protein 1 n=1 Tax=Lygus hesperus TaxID=30085 RepID=A0A146LKF4_LYGHE
MALKTGKPKTDPPMASSSHVSRKDLRKEKRKLKKQTKHENFQKFMKKRKSESLESEFPGKNRADKPGKFVLLNKMDKQGHSNLKNIGAVEVGNKSKGKKFKGSLGEKMNDEILQEKQKFKTVEKAMRKQRNRQLRDANKKEEKTIKLLEKQLKLNKRKNKSIPRSFVDSGLDYILDVCDSSKVQAAVQAEKNLQESASEFEEDLAMITGKAQSKKKLVKKAKDKGISRNKTSSDSPSESEEDDEDVLVDDYDSEMDEVDDEELSNFEDFDESSDDAPEEASSKRNTVFEQKNNSRATTNDVSEDEDHLSDVDNSGEDDENLGSLDESSESELQPPAIKSLKESKLKRQGQEDTDHLKSNKKLKLEYDLSDDEGSIEDDSVCGSDMDVKDNKKQKDGGVHEDIYGRLRDKDGNVIQPNTGKYVPPHLRNQPVDDKKKAELEKLYKTVKGLLNRLAENNMHSISNQIDDLYMRHSRHDMNNTLLKQFLDSLISPVHTPERLVMEHAMLIAVLHANVGSEVGAFFLQHLGKKFQELHSSPKEIENKELDNLILLLCHMYTFKIFDSVLLYDILEQLVQTFTPKDVDLILVVLRTVGFSMRKDNPLALKDFIQKVQKLANDAGDMKDDSRVRFMLDILLSIKNNNVSKIPQYDTTHSEHLKKIIKPMFRKGNYVTELKITLEELLKADERGKWWVVGSAWTGPAPQVEKPKTSVSVLGVNSFTQEILDLAKKQRMNTANRKNIFCILMTAEDYLDAFEKLLKLGLKGQPEQDIIHVLIHCLLSETAYNPYYSHIADQLCMSDRRHRMTIQYAVWDRFKELKTHSNHQLTNLAKFLAHLFIQNSLPLSILKVLEFTEMDKPCVRLLRQVLLSLLLHEDKEAMVAVFSRVAKPSKLLVFRESVRLFMHHFLLKNIKDENAPETVKLKDSISLAEEALMTFSGR